MTKQTKGRYGGKRPNAGRPRELNAWRKVLIVLEETQIRKLDKYSRDKEYRGRSDTVRRIIDEFFATLNKKRKGDRDDR